MIAIVVPIKNAFTLFTQVGYPEYKTTPHN